MTLTTLRSVRALLFANLRDHFYAVLMDCLYERFISGRTPDVWTWFVDRAAAALEVARVRISAAACELRGHDYETEADGESGREDFCCRRCGYGFHVYHG